MFLSAVSFLSVDYKLQRRLKLLLRLWPQATLERVGARGNTSDLDAQPFYRFITKSYPLHVVASLALLFACGGLPALVWGGALRAVWVSTFLFVRVAAFLFGLY